MSHLAKETRRPVWFLLTDRYEDPERWRRLLAAVHAARAESANLTAQIAGRPIGVILGIGTALNPFTVRPSYREVTGLSIPTSSSDYAIRSCAAGSSMRNLRRRK
jgi:N-acyl-D-amino-acid deacylase